MWQINWPELILGSLLGFLVGQIPNIIKRFRDRDVTLTDGDLLIHRSLGSVAIQEPTQGTVVGDRFTVKGTLTDLKARPLSLFDIVLLVRPTDTDDWFPQPKTSVYPEVDGTWGAEITVPKSTSQDVQILGLAISLESASHLRKRSVVHLTKRPGESTKVARIHLRHVPEISWPVPRSISRQTNWIVPAVEDFLAQSNLDLFSVDTALVSWFCPSFESDWGWKDDHDIRFSIDSRLVDHDLPEPLKDISESYKLQHQDKKDSVRYCVTEFMAEPRDSGGRLLLSVRPITYLSAYPISNALIESLTPPSKDDLRRNWFQRMEERSRPLLPNMLIAQVLVVSGDNQLLLQRRRADRGLDALRGHWSASFEEHLNAPWEGHISEAKLFPDAAKPDNTILEGLHRALREELSLSESEIDKTTLRILAAGFEYHNFNTALYVMAELPPALTAEKLRKRLKSGEEHDKITWCSFDIPALKPALMDSSSPIRLQQISKEELENWKWHPTSRMRIVLGLRRRYGEVELERWLEL